MVRPGRIVVTGGGFSGAAFALQAVLDPVAPIPVTIVEPRDALGAGLAYSTTDPDHRLNAPAAIHYAVPEGRDRFQDCYIDAGGLVDDHDAEVPRRGIFVRRRDLAAHVATLLRPHLAIDETVSGICHCRDRVIALRECGETFEVVLENGNMLVASVVVVATGNRPAPPPPPFSGRLESHPAFFATPWEPARLKAIPRDGRILIVGTALTTADIIATLVRQGHRGPIAAISRRGLRPKSHRPPTGRPPPQLWVRIFAAIPGFLEPLRRDPRLCDLLRTLRRHCREVEASGGTWHEPFDELRDSLWRIWPLIPTEDKQRFMRHLRPWYDSHRFRIAPQIEGIVADAESRGVVNFAAARVVSAEPDGDRLAVGLRARGGTRVRTRRYDAVINCTGTVAGPGDDPLSKSLEADGLIRAHGSGMGWDVDKDCHAIRRDGSVHRRLFVIGPPSAGVFGDPFGSPWIVAQIWRMMPAVRAVVGDGIRVG